MNGYKGCVVVQGASYDFIIPKLRKCWEGYQIIFSTWEGENKSLYFDSDIVVYSPQPKDRGIINFNYQKVSTLAGLEKAKELGWDRVVKWRSDLVCKNADGLFELFNPDSLNLYAWVTIGVGYITDYFMEGEIDDLYKMFDTHCEEFAEKMVTHKIYDNGFNKKANYILNEVTGPNDIYFERKDFWLSENIDKPEYFKNSMPDEWCGFKSL